MHTGQESQKDQEIEEEQKITPTVHTEKREVMSAYHGFSFFSHACTLRDLRGKAFNCEALRSLWAMKSA
jgi:hypothetical protein